MKCPFCGATLVGKGASCSRCLADIAYIQERVYPGRQFLFVDATPIQPIAVDLIARGENGPTTHRFSEPAILSRHDYAIRLGPLAPAILAEPWGKTIGSEIETAPEELPRLDLPTLDLVTVITDRKIYRPEDEVAIVSICPGCAGQEAEIEVKLSGQRVYQVPITLDNAGLHVRRYTGLEEGEYSVTLHLPGRPSAQAQCAFSCAEFTLSPLIATLTSHRIDGNRLSLQIKLTQLAAPYDGPVDVKLRSGDHTLANTTAPAKEGLLTTELAIKALGWETPEALVIELVTPEGNTATVALPGSSREEREHIPLCPLDTPVEASLAPFSGQVGTARGLHYGHGRMADTPFELAEIVATEGRLRALKDVSSVHLLVFSPIDATHRTLEFRNVRAGDELAFAVNAPYVLFTLAAFMARGEPYEAWGVVVRPMELQAVIDVPETALPGQVMTARIEVDRPAKCLLLVYDARLEHESPLPKLAKRLFTHVRDATRGLAAQRLAPLARAKAKQYQMWVEYATDFPAVRSLAFGAPDVMLRVVPKSAYGTDVLEDTGLEHALALMLAPRESFPELVFLELFPVETMAEKTLKLGDQIGVWRCRAYLFRDLDAAELTRDIQVDTAVYAELDLPAILGMGDSVVATARYHAQEPAKLTVTTPSTYQSYAVLGDGLVEFPLTEPGQVTTTIVAGQASDVSQRTVAPPGVETVTASRMMLLHQGETVTGRRVVVYPNAMPALQSAIEYLITYPFG